MAAAAAAQSTRQDLSAEGQTALVLAALLAGLTLALGLLPALLAAVSTLGFVTVNSKTRTRRVVTVVGGPAFCSRIAEQLSGQGREVEMARLGSGALVLGDAKEILVDGRRLETFWAEARDIAPGTAIRVAPEGRLDRRSLADALSTTERIVKRTVDIAGATLGLIFAFPILLAAAIAVKADSPGPVFFSQERVGQGGRRFRILKLRTMKTDNDGSAHLEYVKALMKGEAQNEGGMFKLVEDPRITRVGKVLRKLSIDELPQLVNVLLGDMSLVGPRPPMLAEAKMYDEQAWQRLAAKPGLTGLWQVSGRCELDFQDMVSLDLRYVETWSPLLELRILLKTPAAVLAGRGAA
jgi:lipopolysaccharide/colanic/teichoic acid biosynthesis glycosyltransferase